MIYSIFESLLEVIDKILSQGKFSWGAVITALLFFNKIQRNKEFRLRDQRVERNQQRIMAKLGVEGEWASDSRQSGLRTAMTRIFYMPYIYLLNLKGHPNPGRKKIMEKLKSRKFWMAILAVILPVINQEFNLGLDTNTIMAAIGGLAVYILGQSHVDAKAAQNGGNTNVDAQNTGDHGPAV